MCKQNQRRAGNPTESPEKQTNNVKHEKQIEKYGSSLDDESREKRTSATGIRSVLGCIPMGVAFARIAPFSGWKLTTSS